MADSRGTSSGLIKRAKIAPFSGNPAHVEIISPAATCFATTRRFVGAATGKADVKGTSGATIKSFRQAATLSAAYKGGSAATIRRLSSSGRGGMSVAGGSVTTTRRFVSSGISLIGDSGESNATIQRFRSRNGSRYYIRIKSAPMFCGPERKDFGEVFNMIGYCNFKDSTLFLITLISDLKRFTISGNYNNGKFVVNNQSSVGQPQFRHQISIIPKAGFFGSFFQYSIEKAVPIDGDFKWFGADIVIIPKAGLSSEFFTSTGDIVNGW